MPAEPLVPTLGAVVVSYNVRDLLARCLVSLAEDTRRAGVRAETWVVDNASADGSAEMVSERFPDVRLAAKHSNLGFAAANNVVLRPWVESPSQCPELVLLLNPDTEVRPGALVSMSQALQDEPAAGIVGPRLEYPDGTLQHSAFRFPGFAQTVLDLFPVDRLYNTTANGRYPKALYESNQPFEVDFILGACMLVKGSALAAVGLMDERFTMYCEEIDWCRRFRESGWEVLCDPGANVVHHGGASTSQFAQEMFVAKWRSRLRYFAKHETAQRYRLLAATIRIGLRARRVADSWRTSQGQLSEEERRSRRIAYDEILAEL